MFEKNKFKFTRLDEHTTMVEAEGIRFTLGFNYHNEIQLTCSHGLKIRSNTDDGGGETD